MNPQPTTSKVHSGTLNEPIHTEERVLRFYENLIPPDFPAGHEVKFIECMKAVNLKCEDFQNDMPSVGYATCLGVLLGLTIVLMWLPPIIIRNQQNKALGKLNNAVSGVLQQYNQSYWMPHAGIQMSFTAENLPNTNINGLRKYRIHWSRI